MIDKLKNFTRPYITKGESKNVFPSHDGSEESRQEMEYYTKCCMWLFSEYSNERTFGYADGIISDDSVGNECRQYQSGNIPIDKFKKYYLGKNSKGEQRKEGWVNISWRPDLGYLKTLEIMSGLYKKVQYEPNVKALDPTSVYNRMVKKAAMTLLTKKSYLEHLKIVGVNPPGMDDIPALKTKSDIELFEKSGGLTLNVESAMKKALRVSEVQSSMPTIKDMWYDDMVSLGWCVGADYVDLMDNIPKIRYVDPQYYITPCSKYLDFRNNTIGGELRVMNISEIRRESELTEPELLKIARKYGYSPQNGAFARSNNSAYFDKHGNLPYDQIEVWVLDTAWLSSETYKTTSVQTKRGLVFNKVGMNYELSKSDLKKNRKEVNTVRKQFTYKCKWIVGTECSFNYGKEYYQKPKDSDPSRISQLPFHAIRLSKNSKLKRCIADIDEICMLTYKRRNAIANIPAPPGIMINKSALEYVNLNGKVQEPSDLVRMLIEGGVLTFEHEDDHGNPIANINSIIGAVPDKIFSQFKTYSELIEEKRRNIQITTGVNDLTDGTTVAERQLKVVGEQKIQATNNALQMEYSSMQEMIERCFENLMIRWQVVCRHHDVEAKYQPLDKTSIEIIKLTSELSSVKMALTVELAPTEQEKMMLLQTITDLRRQRNESSSGGINEADYINIYRIIMSGNLPLAQLTMAKAIEYQKIEDAEAKRKDIEFNSQQQIQAAQAAEQEKRKSLVFAKSAEMILNNQKAQNALTEIVLKSELEDQKIDDQKIKAMVDRIISNPQEGLNQLSGLLN